MLWRKRILNMTRMKVFWQPLVLLALLVAVGLRSTLPAFAQQEAGTPGISLSARAGFDGYYRQQSPFPLQVTVANSGPLVEGYLQVTLGSVAAGDRVIYTAPISLPTQSNKRVTMILEAPRFINSVTVELRDNNSRLITAVDSNALSLVPTDSVFYAVVSEEPAKLEFLQKVTGSRRNATVAFLAMHELPEAAVAWEALDVLIFHDVDTGLLTTSQREALEKWVRTGGQLVITGGPGWQKTTAAFTNIVPVSLEGSKALVDLPTFAAQIGETFRDQGPYLVTTGSLRSGELLYHEDGLPILARQAMGRGFVYFLALDPRLAPLADWDGSPTLWAPVANALPHNPYWWDGVQNSYSAYTAVSSLPSLLLPSVLGLVLFLILYILFVGPINYWLLKRRGRRELAWVTIPVLVLLFSAAAYFTGFQLKGNDVILNQMSVVYGRVGGEPTRVQALLGLYSPGRATYNLILPADVVARPFDHGFGNLGGSGKIDAISRGSDLIIENVRVDVSGMETFVVETYQNGLPIMARANLVQDGGRFILEGMVQNNSDTLLQNATIILGNQAVSLGDLSPGQEKPLNVPVTTLSSTSASSAGPMYYGPSYGSGILMNHAEKILGTSNYYNDRTIYPRWQLIEALTSNYYGTSVSLLAPADSLTFVAWSDKPQVDVRLAERSYLESATTLYLLEVPLRQQFSPGGEITLPLLMLDWSVLNQNNVYGASVENLYLNMGSVDFAYVPWAGFRDMEVTRLSLVLESMQTPPLTAPPEIYFWDWTNESWERQNVPWGVTEIAEYGRYLGRQNEVRIRLYTTEYGIEIREVYPQLTGNIK